MTNTVWHEPNLSELAAAHHEPDLSHVWGEYVQLKLNSELLVRSIRVYPDGATSLHLHGPEELLVVTRGTITCDLGQVEDQLKSRTLSLGDAIYVPSGWYHRLRHGAGSPEEAIILEVMLGNHADGAYEILRAIEARPGRRPPPNSVTPNGNGRRPPLRDKEFRQ
jgi:mannose-6-phosphate isomerase-like protein (cupin superfamily)